MRTIHKFEIALNKEIQSIDMLEPPTYLHVEYMLHKRSIFLWAEVPADLTVRKQIRRFRIFSTGDGIPDSARYIGTCVDLHLPESYHVYELLE